MERDYTNDEVSAILEYLGDGGNVIIADDFGFGNSFIDKATDFGHPFQYGPEYELIYDFSEEQVVDIEYHNDPDYPLILTDTPQSFKLMLNEPSGFIERDYYNSYDNYYSQNYETLAWTSSQSWLDFNGNYTRDKGEVSGPFPVVIKYSRSSGEYGNSGSWGISNLIMISDPSIFINDMWDQEDNREFTLYLISNMLIYGGEVIFDESVHINENYVYEIPNGFYIFLIFYFNNAIAIFVLQLALLIILISGVIIKRPKYKFQRHEDNLNSKKLFIMMRPKLDNFDHYWIRDILLYKIRVGFDIDNKTFNSFNREQIKILLDDEVLYDFIYKPSDFRSGNVKNIVHRIIEWKPKKKLLKKAQNLVLDAVLIDKDDKNPLEELYQDS
jgi:hypothetical protein